MAAKPHYTLTTRWTLNDGTPSMSRLTGTLDQLIEKLEKVAKPRNLPLFSEGTGPQVETLSRKFHRKTWKWFLDATPEQGGILELHHYPAGAIDIAKATPGKSMAPLLAAMMSDKLVHQWDGDMLHTTPAPVTRAMVKAYAKLINTHLADELGWTLIRVSCEWTSEEARDTEETTD